MPLLAGCSLHIPRHLLPPPDRGSLVSSASLPSNVPSHSELAVCLCISEIGERLLVIYLIEDNSGNNNKRNQFLRKMELPKYQVLIQVSSLLVFFVGERVNRKNKSCSCTSWQQIIKRSFSGLSCLSAATFSDNLGMLTKKGRKENWACTKEITSVPYFKKFRLDPSRGKCFYEPALLYSSKKLSFSLSCLDYISVKKVLLK